MKIFNFLIVAIIAFSLLAIAIPARSPPASPTNQQFSNKKEIVPAKNSASVNLPAIAPVIVKTFAIEAILRAADTNKSIREKITGISATNSGFREINPTIAANHPPDHVKRLKHTTAREKPEIVRLE